MGPGFESLRVHQNTTATFVAVLFWFGQSWTRTPKRVRNVSCQERVLTKFEAYVVNGAHRGDAPQMGIYSPCASTRTQQPLLWLFCFGLDKAEREIYLLLILTTYRQTVRTQSNIFYICNRLGTCQPHNTLQIKL